MDNTSFSLALLPKIYQDLMSNADPRVENLPLMSSPAKLWLIMLVYFWIIKKGPQWMEQRKPLELRSLMVLYNFSMVLLAAYMVFEFCASGWLTGYTLGCVPVDYSYNPKAVRMVHVSWLFFFSKIIELFDTVIFILRKKNNQITFLHVFHHASMPLCVWWGIKFVAGGMGSLMGLVNSIVHVIMYSYYCLSAIGPKAQKFLFWKKYLTRIQLTQFFFLFVHITQLYFINCDYPMIFCVAINIYAILFTVLFLNFYYKEYFVRRSLRKAKNALNHVDSNGVPEKVKKN